MPDEKELNGEEIQSGLPEENPMDEPDPEDPLDLVTIAEFYSPHEAQAAKLHLDEEDIPAFLAGAEAGNVLMIQSLNKIQLQVRRSDVSTAMIVLEKSLEEKTENPSSDEETQCLVCGQKIPEEVTACPACGWSFADQDENRIQKLKE
jgi:hypothetical protein